jgi:hypothetical protein
MKPGKTSRIAVSTATTAWAVATALSVGAPLAYAADGDEANGDTNPWHVDVIYENDTHVRGKDYTGTFQGLSKFRNTMQVEADKNLGGGWGLHSTLRGTYDGVYDLNSHTYGRNAGSSNASQVQIANSAGPIAAAAGLALPSVHLGATVPFGGGVGFTVVDVIEAGAGLPNLGGPGGGPGINAFIDPNYANLNTPPSQYGSGAGLEVLGQGWHDTAHSTGVEFAVPVRPCDIDNRGCRDFGGYGNLDLQHLRDPEFNNRLDFLRELYVKGSVDLDEGKSLFVKVGRQQIVWGRTDLFRVLDVINPVDYSRNNIYDELQDIRIPVWALQTEYRMGSSSIMQDQNLQFIWNFDKFRPNNLGQCGTPNVILDAGCFFRGMANLWDSGGTVANFAPFSAPGTPGPGTGPWFATNFGAHQIGIRNVVLPKWSLSDTQVGVKYEGVASDGLSFSLNALNYRSQLPSLRAFNSGAINPFTGAVGNSSVFSGPGQNVPVENLIAFDMYFPRVSLLGGSMDLTWDAAKAAVRVEGAFTRGEEFANTLNPRLFSENKVFRSVIGIDRPTFIPFISTSRTTLFSGQIFFQHIFDHQLQQGLYGQVGMPDWKDDAIATLLMKGFLVNDRVSPQLILAHDFRAQATVWSPQVDWIVNDKLKLSFGGNFKFANSDSWKFDDCRSCNPYPPYTTYVGQQLVPGSAGVGGIEPLGRFRAGPIGAAWQENEIYFSLRYKL